ncbi:hypothetical protein BN1708_019925, partial [Verticillium longisporum]
QDRRSAGQRQLLLPRVLPPKDGHGLLQLEGSSGPHGEGPSPLVRQRHMGCRRLHGLQVSRARRDLPAGAGPHHLSSPDLHQHEPPSCRQGPG